MTAFRPKQILCPIDAGPVSSAVLHWARRIAAQFGAAVTILYADWVEVPSYFTDAQMALLQAEVVRQRRDFKNELHTLGKSNLGPDIPFTVSVRQGRPVDVIGDFLRTHPADLIVMGSHGHTGVTRLLLGSVAEHVVRATTCPVLIVKEHGSAQPVAHGAQVLCPVNQTPGARNAASLAREFSSAMGARLTLVHVLEPEVPAAMEGTTSWCQWIGAADAGETCQASEITVHGDPAEQVLLFASRHDISLIVVSATHHPFLATSILGRTSLRIMRHSTIPVLLVPYRQAAKELHPDAPQLPAERRRAS
jgi:universal stress protein A